MSLQKKNTIFKLDYEFIESHSQELINLIDYIPFIDSEWLFQDFELKNNPERKNFLKSQELLDDIKEMDELLKQKCFTYDDPVKAINSILIEWINRHPEFEGVISVESVRDYQNMKTKNEFINYFDLMFDNDVPLDEIIEERRKRIVPPGMRESSIPFPDFKKLKEIHEKYPKTLLNVYLTYVV